MTARTGIKQVIQSVTQLFAEPASPAIRQTTPTRRNFKEPDNVATLSTSFRPLDKALEIGGIPHNKITELIAPAASLTSGGTTIIAARIAAKAQLRQEAITVVDMSHNFDPWQAERCGLVAPQLLLTRPDTIFTALASLQDASKKAKLVVVVMGNVVELLNHIEPGLLKTLLQRLRKIVSNSNSVFLFITCPIKNDPFAPENYPTGFPLTEIAAVRLWLQDESWIFKNGLATAYKAGITVIKNNLAMVGKGANIRVKLHNPSE